MKTAANNSAGALVTQYTDPSRCKFFTGKTGCLGAEIDGVTHSRVILSRALPLSLPDNYIVIADVDRNELGIIEDLNAFSPEERGLIENELAKRYFCPVITEILAITEKFGNFYFDVMLGDYKKNFTVKDLTKNVRYHGSGFDLIDVDGNRYRIVDFESIPKKSRRKLEPYLY